MKLYTEAYRNNMRVYVVDMIALSERIRGMTKDQALEVLYFECVNPVLKEVFKISEAEYIERCSRDGLSKVTSMMLENYREARHMVIVLTTGELERKIRLRIAERVMASSTTGIVVAPDHKETIQ